MKKAQPMVQIESVQTHSFLEEAVRQMAREMLAVALRAEADDYIERHSHLRDESGRRVVYGNGLAQERTVQTSIGAVKVRQPRVVDKRQDEQFTSLLLPAYVRRTQQIDAMIPVLYLHGVSTGRMQSALEAIVGPGVTSVSPSVVTGIMTQWQDSYSRWSKRSIDKRYAYIWADGIYAKVRTSNERPCMLVVIGCDEHGNKELLGINDGERESDLSWMSMLTDLKRRGLKAPRMAIGDGALGFWSAMGKVFPATIQQGCVVHATRNVLDKVPKKLQTDVKGMLHQIFHAATHEDAMAAFKAFKVAYENKHPKAVETLERRIAMLLAYYDFPAEHWQSIRSTNVIESTFATIRRRTNQTNGHASREAALAMMFAMAEMAQKNWRKIKGFRHLANILRGIRYHDGVMKVAA